VKKISSRGKRVEFALALVLNEMKKIFNEFQSLAQQQQRNAHESQYYEEV